MSEVKWIKLALAMFDDDKIKFIESLPEADTILTIWIKLLIQAGKCNSNGFIMLTEKIPFTVESLAHQFGRPLNTVKLAINTFIQLEMLELDNNVLFLPNWEKHQNIDGLDKIKQKTRERVAKFRDEKRKLLSTDKKNDQNCNVTGNVTVTQNVTLPVTHSNVTVTQQNKSKNKSKNLDLNNNTSPPPEEKSEAEEEQIKFLTILSTNKDYPYAEIPDRELFKHLKKEFPEIDVLKRISEWLDINKLNMREKTRPRIIEFFKRKPPGVISSGCSETSENHRERILNLCSKDSVLTNVEYAKAFLGSLPIQKPSPKMLRSILEVQYVHNFNLDDFWIAQDILSQSDLQPEINKMNLEIEEYFEGALK